MSQQLKELLYNCVVKITYYYSIVLGISPGPYNWTEQTFQLNKLYHLYSALIQLIFLGITPLTSPYVKQENLYMENKPILQWSYLVGKTARILTIVVISGKIWFNRQNIINICDKYKRFLYKYHLFYKRFRSNIEKTLSHEEQRVQKLMLYKFLSLHLSSLVTQSMFLQMQEKPSADYFLMVSLNLLQTLYLLVANLQFMIVLCEIYLNYVFINKSLEFLKAKKIASKELLNYYMILYEMFVECSELSRECLRNCNAVTLFTLIKMFTTNVIILYHAVLVMMSNIRSDNYVSLVGTVCIVNFYCDSFLITRAVDNVLQTWCHTVDILKGTWITKEEVKDMEMYNKLIQVLNQFSDYLACNKLEFCIYGLVNFDKASSFRYFVSALLHLIILVQFDLKNRLQVE
ncbi:putative gustatory receptor 58a isoform 3-T3 [Cochliomyia hominivorax]